MATVAGCGVLETAYLTWSKLSSNTAGIQALCETTTVGGDCNSVLNGPYAAIPGTDGNVPLAAAGLAAYGAVVLLSLAPLLQQEQQSNNDDVGNATLLTALTTAMGVFSIFLMSLLFGVLHESCAFCVLSAALSVTLAGISWLGPSGGRDDKLASKERVRWSASAGLASFCAALVLFASNGPPPPLATSIGAAQASDATSSDTTTVLLTDNKGADSNNVENNRPPPITTKSSPEALALSRKLRALDAKMYGAFWCNHCYDQKQALGRQAMENIPYIECSKDGYNAQTSLCKQQKVPGYPTWEIDGQLYPGEQALDELEEIVRDISSAS